MGRTTELRRAAFYVVATIMAGFGLTSVASAQSYTNTSGWGGSSPTLTQNNCSITNSSNAAINNSTAQSASSGNASVSGGSAGLSWGGWDALSPTNAQAQGNSYGTWRNGVVGWIANRADGAGWANAGSGTPGAPGGDDWASFDPMTWQADGQSFGDWYNAAEGYLNNNSPAWLLGWPSSDNGSGGSSASTGSATNSNSANFSININNAASAKFGTPKCGQGYVKAPSGNCPCSGYVAGTAGSLTPQGGYGVGPGTSQSESAPASAPGYNSGSGSFTPGYSAGQAAYGQGYPTPSEQGPGANNASVNCPPPPPCGCGSSSSAPKVAPSNAVVKSSATSTSVVSINNATSQTAASGNSTVNGSGYANQSGTGNAGNGNGTGLDANVDN